MEDLEQFLTARIRRCSPKARLRRLVVYGASEDDIADERLYVQCIQRYAGDGLDLERSIGRLGNQNSAPWMEHDPEARGWEEASLLNSPSY